MLAAVARQCTNRQGLCSVRQRPTAHYQVRCRARPYHKSQKQLSLRSIDRLPSTDLSSPSRMVTHVRDGVPALPEGVCPARVSLALGADTLGMFHLLTLRKQACYPEPGSRCRRRCYSRFSNRLWEPEEEQRHGKHGSSNHHRLEQ